MNGSVDQVDDGILSSRLKLCVPDGGSTILNFSGVSLWLIDVNI